MNKGAARERGEVGTWGQGSCPPPDQSCCPPSPPALPAQPAPQRDPAALGAAQWGWRRFTLAKSDLGANSNSLQALQAKQAGTSTTTIEGTYGGGRDKKQGKPTESRAQWSAGSPAGLRHQDPSVPALRHTRAQLPTAPGGAQQCAGTSGPSPQRDPTALGAHRNIPHQVGVAAQQLTQQEMGADEALLSPLPTGEVPRDPGGQCWHHVSLVSTPPPLCKQQPPSEPTSWDWCAG